MSSFWSSPCSACKFQRRKCTNSCVLAPYFPPHEPYKFSCVHKVFGVSNMMKMLNDIVPEKREAAVKTLVYEADALMTNTVYSSIRYIHLLQQQVDQLRMDLHNVSKELATYIGPDAFDHSHFSAPAPAPSQFHHPQFQGSAPFAEQEMMGLGLATSAATPQPMIWDQSQWQMLEEARLMMEVDESDAAQEQQMFSSYDLQQQEQELLRLINVEQLGDGVKVAIAEATESAGGLSLHPPSDHHQNLPSSTPSKEM